VLYHEGVRLPPKRRVKNAAKRVPAKPVRQVKITEKDPLQMCGKGTSVERLFRVEEKGEKTKVMHLVFFDRHGWYCEHGAQCLAVTDVRKYLRNGR
jgi:hypothetical protein